MQTASMIAQPVGPPSNASPAEQELRNFSYIVSHDISAAFRHVAEFSELLLMEIGDGATEQQQTYAGYIRRETARCKAMLDELLTYSRVQQRDLKREYCDGTRLMELALLQVSAEANAANADLSIEPLGEVFADADLLTTAFRLVLSNAIKFRRPHVDPVITVRGLETEDAWIVQVIDNGIGVALDRQEKMFGMFYQDHAQDAYPGVGAGLPHVRRILRRHDGDAYFLGGFPGACLEIVLPAAESSQRARSKAQ